MQGDPYMTLKYYSARRGIDIISILSYFKTKKFAGFAGPARQILFQNHEIR